jgi:long-chain fatty acid transport protein
MATIRPSFKPVAVALVIAVALFEASGVKAGALFELTGANQGLGGFNARVTGASPASTYFNPGLIAFADAGVHLGVFVVSDQISLILDGRPTTVADIPTGVSSYSHPDRSALSPVPIPTSSLENGIDRAGVIRAARPRQGQRSSGETRTYSTVGLVTRIYERYVVLGLNASIPLGGFTAAKSFYNDEREQFFSNSLHPELLSDRLDTAEFAFGVSSRILDNLAFGTSFTLRLENNALTPVYVSDAAQLGDVLIDADIQVNTVVSPHFGLVYEPVRRLRLTATLHTVQSMQIGTQFSYLLNSGMEQGASPAFTYGYVPWSVGLGASFDLIKPPPEAPQGARLMLVGTALLSNWNEYRDRHNEKPIDGYTWSRTISPSLGARYCYAGWGTLLDVNYVPSPVPLQTGRSNYVDNDRIGLNAGVQYTFTLAKSHFRVGLQFQAHQLLSRYQKKLAAAAQATSNKSSDALVIDEIPDDAIDNAHGGQPAEGRRGLQTNNPGWPGFESQGWIIAGGGQLALVFN